MCMLWTCIYAHMCVSLYMDLCAVGMCLCASVCTVRVCLCAQSENVFLGHPDTCVLVKKSQSCPGQESVSVRMRNCAHEQLWPSGRLSLVQSHLAGDPVAQRDLRPQVGSSAS